MRTLYFSKAFYVGRNLQVKNVFLKKEIKTAFVSDFK